MPYPAWRLSLAGCRSILLCSVDICIASHHPLRFRVHKQHLSLVFKRHLQTFISDYALEASASELQVPLATIAELDILRPTIRIEPSAALAAAWSRRLWYRPSSATGLAGLLIGVGS